MNNFFKSKTFDHVVRTTDDNGETHYLHSSCCRQIDVIPEIHTDNSTDTDRVYRLHILYSTDNEHTIELDYPYTDEDKVYGLANIIFGFDE